jgi:hypothetical protein
VLPDHALQLVDGAGFDEVAQHLKNAPRTQVERRLRHHLIATAHRVLDQELLATAKACDLQAPASPA